MKKSTKTWLIIATALVLIGFVIWVGVMMSLEWNFLNLSTTKYETKTHNIAEDFNALSLTVDVADVTILPSEDGKCAVEYYEQKNMGYTVELKDDTLVIESTDTRKWHEFISINVGSPKITVYLPKKEFTSLFKIKASTGRISMENVNVGALDLKTSTGKITVSNVICNGDMKTHVSTGKTSLTNVKCQNFVSNGNTGNISLHSVDVAEKLNIERSTGDVKLEASDAAEIFIKTNTGDVKGTLLSNKIIFATSNTGGISVPKTTSGGRCEITTSTGDIKIEIQE